MKEGIIIGRIDETPLEKVSYLTIPTGESTLQEYYLPIYKGIIDGLPASIDAVIITSDLQGTVSSEGGHILLGEELADHLTLILNIYFPHIQSGRVAVFLCGDLYCNLLKRGATGDPATVWKKFASNFGKVIGIAGNHDEFEAEYDLFKSLANVTFLENGITEFEGLRIGGLSGIIGRSDKNFRMVASEYVKALNDILKKDPDILLTHLSPDIPELGFQGDQNVTSVLYNGNVTTLFCGHSHWDCVQAYQMENGSQILNADSKVFILTRG